MNKLKNKSQMIIIVSSFLIILISLIALVIAKSYAIYKLEKDYDVIKSVIGDFRGSVVNYKYYIDDTEVADMPSKDQYKYVSNSCDNANGSFDANDWSFKISDATTRVVNCSITFTKINNLYELVKSQSLGLDTVVGLDYDKISSDSNGKGVYSTTNTDSGKEVYFYRGDVNNNNVLFGGFCWKIVRTTETGGVKLIYNGIPSENNECNNIGIATTIGTSVFNSVYNDNASVGYMYGNTSATSYEETHKNTKDSDIKKYIDNWFSKYLSDYTGYLEDTVWCNDRSLVAGGENNSLDSTFKKSGYGKEVTGYGSLSRVSYDSISTNPSLKCIQNNDKFTVSTENGNGNLTYPVGTITADELVYAGTTGGGRQKGTACNNTKFYLYSNTNYWTMTPIFMYTNSRAYVNRFYSGRLVNNYSAEYTNTVRPMISLNGNLNITNGNGQPNSPLVISDIKKVDTNLNHNVKIGDYIYMVPSLASYTITSELTGCTGTSNTTTACNAKQNIKPSDLRIWRVLKINEDNTIEAISEYVSNETIYFYGKTGYMNWVGGYNTLAKQYYNKAYTLDPNDSSTPKKAFREIGFYDQTEWLTDENKIVFNSNWKNETSNNDYEKEGWGDVNYKYDVDLVKNILGNLIATNSSGTAKNYVLSSRVVGSYLANSTSGITENYFEGRYINTTGSVVEYNLYWYRLSTNLYSSNRRGAGVRPIITFKANINALGSGTKDSPWMLIN